MSSKKRPKPIIQKIGNKKWCSDSYYKNRLDRLRKMRERESKLKLEVFLAYTAEGKPHCVQCGVSDIDVLCIDHVFNGGNEHRRQLGISSGTVFYRWLKKNNFPDGFQILCFNCNRKKEMVRLRELHQQEEELECQENPR